MRFSSVDLPEPDGPMIATNAPSATCRSTPRRDKIWQARLLPSSRKVALMGIYRDRVLPRLQDKAMARPLYRDIRARVCSGLVGRVVEVGFGSGR